MFGIMDGSRGAEVGLLPPSAFSARSYSSRDRFRKNLPGVGVSCGKPGPPHHPVDWNGSLVSGTNVFHVKLQVLLPCKGLPISEYFREPVCECVIWNRIVGRFRGNVGVLLLSPPVETDGIVWEAGIPSVHAGCVFLVLGDCLDSFNHTACVENFSSV